MTETPPSGDAHPAFRPFLLERYFAAHEFSTQHMLSASDCESWELCALLDACGADAEELLTLRLGYTESQGDPTLRARIAEQYPGCDASSVLVANAPMEAIAVAMQATLQPGSRVVVQTPCYQALLDIPRQLGCEVIPWPLLRVETTFAIDWHLLEQQLAQPTDMVVTNFPHNPTGLHPQAAQWERLSGWIERSGARWFSDEMYRGLERENDDALPPAATINDRAISLWGLSKSFGLPGLRLGWLVSRDPELLAAVEARKDFTSICTNAVAEYAGKLALAHTRKICDSYRTLIGSNLERMAAFAERHRQVIRWHPPQAGPVGLCHVTDGTASEMAERVRQQDALLVPSRLFGLEDRWLRIGLGRADFEQALQCWDRALND